MSIMKKQQLAFGITMSCAMTAGMELYNLSLRLGVGRQAVAVTGLGRALLSGGLLEMAGLSVLVFILANLWGAPCGAALAAGLGRPGSRLLRQLGTVAAMCPAMSLVAALLFNVIPGQQPLTQLPALWLTTFLRNLPMALGWSLLAAAPFARWLAGRLCGRSRAAV